jgi:hypothetical protein
VFITVCRSLHYPCSLQDIEAVLKHWAATFEIPETELHNRIMAAADGKLAKPPVNVSSTARLAGDRQHLRRPSS